MIETFGTLGDGTEVKAITLGVPDGLRAQILTYGGILRRLTVPSRGGVRDVVVTLPDLDRYVHDTTFQGILVGRVSNRIENARFVLDGRIHRITANDGAHQLHGGRAGFGKRVWEVLNVETGSHHRLSLGLKSRAGDEGYPGNLDVSVEFTIEDRELRVRFEARCDEATPFSPTFHPYFNLSGDSSRETGEMLLRVPAETFLPVRDAQLIPTGERMAVDGTPFDFRALRSVTPSSPISHPQLVHARGYDHCWVLDRTRDCDAELCSPSSGIRMTVSSDRPGLQFYGGQHLQRAHDGMRGICLEPQGFPNAVNEPAFPSCLLRPGETFRTAFVYRFADS